MSLRNVGIVGRASNARAAPLQLIQDSIFCLVIREADVIFDRKSRILNIASMMKSSGDYDK